MDIYCWQHKANHRLTAGQAERLIYALGAGVADAMTQAEDEREDAGRDSMEVLPCPVAVLDMARDPEGYAEHVEAGVESRRLAAREGPVATG